MLSINSLNSNKMTFKSKVSSSKLDAQKLARMIEYKTSKKSCKKTVFLKSLEKKVIGDKINFIQRLIRTTSNKLAEQKALRLDRFNG